MQYALSFFVPLCLVLALVPLFARIAHRIGFEDKPTERKQHGAPKPLVGGIAMFLGFTACAAFCIARYGAAHAWFLLGGFLILAIGVVDDFYKTKSKEFAVLPRVAVHLLAATLAFAAGARFTGFMNPFTDVYVVLPVWLQYGLTVLWIFGVTTVVNWSDGMDGLAGGLSALCCGTLAITALYKGQPESALMAFAVMGAILGFLRYNIIPAKVYMGDSGANFLGFMIAIISLHGSFKQATVISSLIPVLALGVPIFDNLFVVAKRFVERRPIYAADAGQIHHRLLKRGLKPAHVLVFLFLVSACLNLTSIILMFFA